MNPEFLLIEADHDLGNSSDFLVFYWEPHCFNVFALTMGALVVSDLRILGQVGTTIGLGLLFDAFVVRSFMVPSIATLLGRWFWWPMNVRTRPPRPRPAVADVVAGGTFPAGRFAAVNWVFGTSRTGKNPESRQKSPRDAQRDHR